MFQHGTSKKTGIFDVKSAYKLNALATNVNKVQQHIIEEDIYVCDTWKCTGNRFPCGVCMPQGPVLKIIVKSKVNISIVNVTTKVSEPIQHCTVNMNLMNIITKVNF